jgi:hypothetical protein
MRSLVFPTLALAFVAGLSLASEARQNPGPRRPGTSAAPASASGSCDRRCLLQFLTEYTEALTDNNTSRLAVASTLRVTNNGELASLGRGDVWGGTRRLPYRHAFVDPVTGAAVFYGVVTTVSQPSRTDTPGASATPRWWYWIARLKIENRRITEIEEIAYERMQGAFGADASTLTLADRIFDTVLLERERSTRDELFAVANKYFDAVSHRIDYHDVPWHPECQRVELGVFTVNTARSPGSCGGEFQVPSVWWNVENRRFYVADVERGVVLAAGNFMAPKEYPKNNPSVVMEVFKVQDGMIRHIFAFFRGNGQPRSGWGTGPGA